MIQQETVALGYFCGGDGGRGSAVEKRDGAASAPVHYFNYQPAVASRLILGRNQGEIGFKTDAAGIINRRVFQVYDSRVGRVAGIDGKRERSLDAFVLAIFTERSPIGVGTALLDVHSNYGHDALLTDMDISRRW